MRCSNAVLSVALSFAASPAVCEEVRVAVINEPAPGLDGRFGVAPICNGFAMLPGGFQVDKQTGTSVPKLIALPLMRNEGQRFTCRLEALKDYQIQHISSGGDLLCVSGWQIHGEYDSLKENCVFVYRVSAGACALEATLTPQAVHERGQGFYKFGEPTIVRDDRILVTEVIEHPEGDDEHVVLNFYRKDASGWMLDSTFQKTDGRNDQRCPAIGWKGNVLAIQDGDALVVYERKNDKEWTEVSRLRPPLKYACTAGRTKHGEINDVADNRIVIGEPTHNYGSGSVYLYEKQESGKWQFAQCATLYDSTNASDSKTCDEFGRACAFVGKRVAVKASSGAYVSTAFLWDPQSKDANRLKQLDLPPKLPPQQKDRKAEVHAVAVNDELWSLYNSRYVENLDPIANPLAAKLTEVAAALVKSGDPTSRKAQRDPWGHEVQIEVGVTVWEEQKWFAVSVLSAGPDGEFQTEDDMTVHASNWTPPPIEFTSLQKSEFCGNWEAPKGRYKIDLDPQGACTITTPGWENSTGEWTPIVVAGKKIAVCRFYSGPVRQFAFHLLDANPASNSVRVEDIVWPITKPTPRIIHSTLRAGNAAERGVLWVKVSKP